MANVLGIGELVSWEFPEGHTFRQSQLVFELAAAGLDPSFARPICEQFAFGRACKMIDKKAICKKVKKQGSTITYQVNATVQVNDQIEYPLSTQVSMDKDTGTVTCPDSSVLSRVLTLMLDCIESRSIDDACRTLCRMIEQKVSLVISIRKGSRVYFIPAGNTGFVNNLEAFVKNVGGVCKRFDQFDTPSTTAAVAVATSDAIEEVLTEYERDMIDYNRAPTARKLKTLAKSVQRANDLVWIHRQRLGAHASILEDHVAHVAKLLSDAQLSASQSALATPSVCVP